MKLEILQKHNWNVEQAAITLLDTEAVSFFPDMLKTVFERIDLDD